MSKEYTRETHVPAEGFKVEPVFAGFDRQAFHWRDREHTPYHKRPGSVKAQAFLIVDELAVGGSMRIADAMGVMTHATPKGWVSIRLEENIDHPSGRSQSKVISVSLGPDARRALLAYLQRDQEQPAGGE